METQWRAESTGRGHLLCQGAGLGLGREGWVVMLCWTRQGEAAAGRGTSMYRTACPDRIREVQMVHLSCRIFPLPLGTSGSGLKEYLDYQLASQ